MTPEFQTAFQERLESLVADLQYFNKPTETLIAPRVVQTQLTDRKIESDVFPFVCWSTHKFSFADRAPHTFGLKIVVGVHVDDSGADMETQKAEGYEAITELATTVCRGLLADRFFTPYKITGDVSGRIGDEDGRQPVPQFFAEIDLTMIAFR